MSIKNQIRPLDLILFRGNDGVSETIRAMEKEVLGNGDWSHCGIILTTDVVPIKNGIPGELYIWESTFDLVKDVELDDYVFGVQIRSFDEVVSTYNKPLDTRVAWCKLKDNPIYDEKSNVPEIKEKLLTLYQVYNHVGYNYSPCDLISTIHPKSAACFNCCCCCCIDVVKNKQIPPKIQYTEKEKENEYEKKTEDEIHQLLGY